MTQIRSGRRGFGRNADAEILPRTGAWGETDLCQVTLTPADDPDNHVDQRQTGVGKVRFHKAELVGPPDPVPCRECAGRIACDRTRGGTVTRSHGGKSYRDQRVLA